MPVDIKGRKRAIGKQYKPWGGLIYKLQVYERNHFKEWLTVACTTDASFAAQWGNTVQQRN